MIPDWLAPMIALAPLAAWMFLGVGIPWALALLPRGLWRERTIVIAVGMALGPLGYTAVMALLGAAGALRLAPTLADRRWSRWRARRSPCGAGGAGKRVSTSQRGTPTVAGARGNGCWSRRLRW